MDRRVDARRNGAAWRLAFAGRRTGTLFQKPLHSPSAGFLRHVPGRLALRFAGLFTILAYGELAYGLWLPKGGIYALVEGIEKLARELGVEIHTNKRVKQIVVKDRRVAGIQSADGEFHAAKLVVSNVDVPTTNTELLGDYSLRSTLRSKLSRTKMTPGVMTFYWGIRGQVETSGITPSFCRRISRARSTIC